MYETYKNTTIESYEDAAGITNTARQGETQLGADFFTGEELAPTDQVISRRLVCDRCGFSVKSKKNLKKQKGFMVCKDCFDG